MRILFVHETLGFQGGVEQTVADSAERLRARGHRVALAWGPRRGQEVDRFLGFFEDHTSWESLSELRARFSPDVIYLHKAPSLSVLDGCWGRHRVVRMVHDHDLTCPRRHRYDAWTGQVCTRTAGWHCWLDGAFVSRREGQLNFVNLFAHGRELRRHRELDALLVGSRYMADEMLRHGLPSERVHLLPPLMSWRAPSAPVNLPEIPELLFVGQLIRGKGADLLLHALSRCRPEVRLTVVGDGSQREELAALCQRLGLGARVRLVGFLPHSQVGQLYARARAVVVPSRWPEPFGMVGVEALSRQRPVVAFGVGGVSDWLEHERNGLLVAPGRVGELALALERVLFEPGLAERLAEHSLTGLERFHPDRHLEGLERILEGRAA